METIEISSKTVLISSVTIPVIGTEKGTNLNIEFYPFSDGSYRLIGRENSVPFNGISVFGQTDSYPTEKELLAFGKSYDLALEEFDENYYPELNFSFPIPYLRLNENGIWNRI